MISSTNSATLTVPYWRLADAVWNKRPYEERVLGAQDCLAGVKACDLDWMYTIWVVYGQLRQAAGDCQVPQMQVATSPGPMTEGE